ACAGGSSSRSAPRARAIRAASVSILPRLMTALPIVTTVWFAVDFAAVEGFAAGEPDEAPPGAVWDGSFSGWEKPLTAKVSAQAAVKARTARGEKLVMGES